MDVLPLSHHHPIGHYRDGVNDLVKAARSEGQAGIKNWGADWLEELCKQTMEKENAFVYASYERAINAIEKGIQEKSGTPDPSESGLIQHGQLLLASAHGFENWDAFTKFVARAPDQPENGFAFESAVDAIVDGDLDTLQSLLSQFPALVEARSARMHQAMLLHYIAANGVEDFRQRTPDNAIEIARHLLESGAEVDALANTYGGGKRQTTMNLLVSSAHPAAAGLMVPLVEALLDFGAAINGLEDDGSPLMTALSAGYLEAAEALTRKGARIDNIVAAAALGLVDLVDKFLNNEKEVKQGQALVSASTFGQTQTVAFMLDRGVEAGSLDRDDMTGLHWATARGHMDVVRLLLDRGAPLEVKNKWGGTVLGSTVFFAHSNPMAQVDFVTVIETLLSAGAQVSAAKYPTGLATVDAVLHRYRDAAE